MFAMTRFLFFLQFFLVESCVKSFELKKRNKLNSSNHAIANDTRQYTLEMKTRTNINVLT